MIFGSLYTWFKNDQEKIVDETCSAHLKISWIETKLKIARSIFERFLKLFSVKHNAKFIFSTNISDSSIPAIHGIKTLGMSLIIVAHVCFYTLAPMDNLLFSFNYAEWFLVQLVLGATVSADSFFAVSGLLMSYHFYEREKKRPSKDLFVSVVKGIVYRYIRIAPCLLIVILLAVSLAIFLNDTSQFLLLEDIEGNCKRFWWRNLLFIQNFYPFTEMCLSWSWFVAVDLQLFTVTSILMVLLKK